MRKLLIIAAFLLALSCSNRPKDGHYELHLLTTNDLHGAWFDSNYVNNKTSNSLLSIKVHADSIRSAVVDESVLLIDAGDALQGNNAAYYYNYVDTKTAHLFPRLLDYMGYDAAIVGNHDVETGHEVYDRIASDLKKLGIPYLGGNAVTENGSYFPLYKVFKKGGLKVALLGYTNANMKNWLTEELWSGMDFNPIIKQAQEDIDMVRAKENPDVLIIATHTATGSGDGEQLEAEGLDLLESLKGVDFIVCAHDHAAMIKETKESVLINAGSHARFLGHGIISLDIAGGEVVSKSLSAELIPVSAKKTDPQMRAAFQKDYEAVKAFTTKEIGVLKSDLGIRESFVGMSDYMNFIHSICLSCSPAQISFAAPLKQSGLIKEGTIVYNDLFTLYPFENQLFVLKMSGKEVKDYLEQSYNLWINSISSPAEHLLRIQSRPDQRTGQERWSFVERSYNFDSAAGLCYEVDVTKPFGQRINILSMADGSEFSPEAEYNVAMTSYRASGGGGLMVRTGVDTKNIGERVVAKYPEIRNMIYDYIIKNGGIDPAAVSAQKSLGHWSFVPSEIALPALEQDYKLMFGR